MIGTSFTTTGDASTATADQLRRAGPSYPALITRDFLDLTDDPTHGAATIRALALQWTASATNAYDKAAIIEATLRNPQLFHYTLTPPTPPPVTKKWPVTYFLTTSHAGYCQYYAAAMGAMLRALGIPSRLINGYGPGHGAERRQPPHQLGEQLERQQQRRAHLGGGVLPALRLDPLRAHASVPGRRLPAIRRGARWGRPRSRHRYHPGRQPRPRRRRAPTRRPPSGSGARARAAAGPCSWALPGWGWRWWCSSAGSLRRLVPAARATSRGVWRRVGIIGRLLGVPS